MPERDDVLHRLKDATRAELTAIAAVLAVELGEERETNLVRLVDAYRKAASETVYRKTLVSVAREVANQANWKLETIPDAAEPVWVEDYVYQALGFVHRPDRGTLSDHEKAKARQGAEQALSGQLPSPQVQSDAAGAVLSVVFDVVAFVPLAAAGLFGAAMKKVVPATLTLIHIRKRREFEEVLTAAARAT